MALMIPAARPDFRPLRHVRELISFSYTICATESSAHFARHYRFQAQLIFLLTCLARCYIESAIQTPRPGKREKELPVIRFLLPLIFLVAPVLHAQNPPLETDVSPASPPKIIDGSVHPELIPDVVAYRLFLLTISTSRNPTAKELARQRSHLGMVHLGPQDLLHIIPVLRDFRSQYDSLISDYNQSASEALQHGKQPDVEAFLQRRDALVQKSRGELKLALTPDGAARLDAYVQIQKRMMKIDAAESHQ